MKLLLLGAADVERALPMAEAVPAMREAFAAFSAGTATIPHRTVLPAGPEGAALLVKPGVWPTRALGAKLAAVFPANARRGLPATSALMVLHSLDTGEPEALVEGSFLTAWRTGAASGVATRLLAAPDAAWGAVLGAGGQARTQVLGIDAVRELERIRVWARRPEQARALVEELSPRTRAPLAVAASLEDAVAAPILCCATTATEPLFPGAFLRPGTHVNAIGSFTPAMRELDVEAVRRARVYVDSRESARREAGELIAAAEAGATDPAAWHELGDLVQGFAPGRTGETEITLFKSVGLAVQDLAAAAAVLKAARSLGLGRTIEL